MPTDGYTHRQTDRQTETDFIIWLKRYAIAMGQIKTLLKVKWPSHTIGHQSVFSRSGTEALLFSGPMHICPLGQEIRLIDVARRYWLLHYKAFYRTILSPFSAQSHCGWDLPAPNIAHDVGITVKPTERTRSIFQVKVTAWHISSKRALKVGNGHVDGFSTRYGSRSQSGVQLVGLKLQCVKFATFSIRPNRWQSALRGARKNCLQFGHRYRWKLTIVRRTGDGSIRGDGIAPRQSSNRTSIYDKLLNETRGILWRLESTEIHFRPRLRAHDAPQNFPIG